MNSKYAYLALGTLFSVSLIVTVVSYFLHNDPLRYEYFLTITVSLAIISLVCILISFRNFFAERRVATARLLQEVRTHRAETKLLRADVESISADVTSLVQSVGRPDSGQRVFQGQLQQLSRENELDALHMKDDSRVNDPLLAEEANSSEVGTELSGLHSALEDLKSSVEELVLNHENSHRETLEHITVRSKTLLALLELQRHQLVTVSDESMTTQDQDSK